MRTVSDCVQSSQRHNVCLSLFPVLAWSFSLPSPVRPFSHFERNISAYSFPHIRNAGWCVRESIFHVSVSLESNTTSPPLPLAARTLFISVRIPRDGNNDFNNTGNLAWAWGFSSITPGPLFSKRNPFNIWEPLNKISSRLSACARIKSVSSIGTIHFHFNLPILNAFYSPLEFQWFVSPKSIRAAYLIIRSDCLQRHFQCVSHFFLHR